MSNKIIKGSWYISSSHKNKNMANQIRSVTTFIGAIRENGYDDTPIEVTGINELESNNLANQIVNFLNSK